jgi:Pentapeptide repeats (8 copies)
MIIHEKRHRPLPWEQQRARSPHAALIPFFAIEWAWDWIAYALSNWSFLEVLEYLGSFSVLIAVVLFFKEAPDRVKQKHYQAWQVINTAQGKGGSGGRIDALNQLNHDGVPLIGVDVAQAFLQGVRLPGAKLSRANLSAVDARDSTFDGSDLSFANLNSANFRRSHLRRVSLREVNLSDADLNSADLSGSDLTDATLDNADLRFANLDGIVWKQIKSIKGANILGIKNAPPGFSDWARQNGAVETQNDAD